MAQLPYPFTWKVNLRFVFCLFPGQTFAESTMNELLGWYGYDKVDLRESEASEIRNYRERRQHVSVLKGEGKWRSGLEFTPTGSAGRGADTLSH